MSHASLTDLLTLHAVRLKGFADGSAISGRFDLDVEATVSRLEAYAADAWITHSAFGGLAGWSLTEDGRRVNEAQLAEELDTTASRDRVGEVHERFLPLNAIVSAACSSVQLDPETFEQSWQELSTVASDLGGLEDELTSCLSRFGGYHQRFSTALFRADDDPTWLTGTDVDSCHKVWFELHEDLIATLGLSR